ncbi:antibiotic biosynthesis monooxygenase [Priestia megaterium]|nr:antibiotic biosynthesis monooxygenase [Priestia megaterium]
MKNLSVPYYAVIFSSQRTAENKGYEEMAEEMAKLASQQKGFLGVESVRGEDGFGITISYWKSMEDIKRWGQNSRHQLAQEKGKNDWYESFSIKICKVENER